jgi:hypothetical protein
MNREKSEVEVGSRGGARQAVAPGITDDGRAMRRMPATRS